VPLRAFPGSAAERRFVDAVVGRFRDHAVLTDLDRRRQARPAGRTDSSDIAEAPRNP
jgi:hypothetical protein